MRWFGFLTVALVLSCACVPTSQHIKDTYATVIAALQATPAANTTRPPQSAAATSAPHNSVAPIAPVATAGTISTPAAVASGTPITAAQRPSVLPTVTANEPLRVVAQGFGHTRVALSYAFIVENQNQSVAFENVGYRAAFYNAAGVVMQSDTGKVELVLPGQRLGQANDLTLGRVDAIVRIDVTFQPDRVVRAASLPSFGTEQLAYTPGLDSGRVSGVVQNPFAADLRSVLVSAIALDDAGAIIGGGFSNIPLLPAHGRARGRAGLHSGSARRVAALRGAQPPRPGHAATRARGAARPADPPGRCLSPGRSLHHRLRPAGARRTVR